MIRKRLIGFTFLIIFAVLLLYGAAEYIISYFSFNMDENLIRIGALAIILLLVVSTVMHYVSKGITLPLHKLLRSANEMNSGDTSAPIERFRRDEIGKLAEAFETMRIHVNESKQLQAQYEENRKKLMQNMSRDLKRPLTSIKGCAEELREWEDHTEEEMHRSVQTIHTKALVLDKLVNDLFMFSQLDLGKLVFHYKQINLRSFFIDIMEEFEKEWEEVSFTFTADQSQSYQTRIDPEQMRKVFINVLDNSLKYNDKQDKEIEIAIEDKKSEIIVSIKDNGPGILDQDFPHIFEHFYRADMAREAAPSGSGLGLPVAKRIVEQHDGKIDVKTRKGHSTTVMLTLPKAD
ncbi:HAMP domain-containing histidine kinase [Halobacillus salinarum]|uniref:histidine kinase n=1 Tax=Halobacillus salinarum TaxID=2932257 RepID=A0ABY4EMC7_9BACI|nr:HAMP domain-containing sensor histidine kinase [Halobacillus salinarum]UOQ45607.1 HAMP domain-containing histidine kinase [Halobacillus salinarum]